MSIETIYYLSDHIIEVDGLINKQTNAYINNAVVIVTLKTLDGVNVTGETWPLSMSYVASSNGKYRATLKYTLSLSKGLNYVAHIDANGGAGLQRHWETILTVMSST